MVAPFKLDGKIGKARLRLPHVVKLRDGLIAKENGWFEFAELNTDPPKHEISKQSIVREGNLNSGVLGRKLTSERKGM